MKKLVTIIFLFSLNLIAGIGVGESIIGSVPVELISFSARVIGSDIKLAWSTATEIQNYGFEILRFAQNDGHSEEGIDDESWEKIGFVEGHGNSNSPKEYTFIDNVHNGFGYYSYRLKQIDTDGKFIHSKVVTVVIKQLPDCFELFQNYPNPFNPSTSISYSIPKTSHVVLTIHDVLGNLIATLVNEMQEAGIYRAIFCANELSNGVYYYKIQARDFVSIKKMLLLK